MLNAHSQGGTTLYCALKKLPAEDRAKITVHTFGSASIIDAGELGLEMHIII